MLLEHCLWPFRITYGSPCIAYDYLPFGVLNRQNAIANFIMVMGKVVVSIVILSWATRNGTRNVSQRQ